MTTFGQRLRTALDTYGALCVGIDPHESLLSAWGLTPSAEGARELGLRVVDAAAGRVGVVKPQVAFFEQYGSRGIAALEDVQSAARAAGLIVIADAKRGDIGSTMAGYTSAWLSPGSPLEADAVTLSPYLGPDSLIESLRTALRFGKGAFVLAATSNPEAATVQRALVDDGSAEEGQRVAERVARDVGSLNIGLPGSLGSLGVVVGATVDRAAFGLTDIVLAGTPVLAPGFGAQGADPADLPALFGYGAGNVVANESRSILSAGPAGIAARIDERASRYEGSTRG